MKTTLKVGLAQYAPVHMNKEATMQKIRTIVGNAATKGVQLLALGETWLSGYPSWLDYSEGVGLWGASEVKEVFSQMVESSVTVPGPETDEICLLAKEHKMGVVLGVNERVDEGPGNGSC